MCRRFVAIISFAAACLLTSPLASASKQAVTLVELFTSQGCSSCPPADAIVGELAKRRDVLPLSMHVDYWDYLGWKDPFATAANTQRQRDYAARLGLRYVYTPQMVIHGTTQVTGSDRDAVVAAIETAKSQPRISLNVRHGSGGNVEIEVGEGDPSEPATIWLAMFDHRHVTHVARGENSGREMMSYNIVRRLRAVGDWSGDARSLSTAIPDGDDGERACAVWVQGDRTGKIFAVGRLDLNPR